MIPPRQSYLPLGSGFSTAKMLSWRPLGKPVRGCTLHPAPVDPAGPRQLMQHFHSRPTAITLGPRWDPVALRAPDPSEQHNAPHHVTADPVGSHQQKATDMRGTQIHAMPNADPIGSWLDPVAKIH